jgi:hypothetical protein
MYIHDRYMPPVYKHGNDVRIMLKKLNGIYMTFYKTIYSHLAEIRVIVRL